MDRGAWQATVHGVAKSRTQLSDFHLMVNGIVSLISLCELLLSVHRNARDFCINFVSSDFTRFIEESSRFLVASLGFSYIVSGQQQTETLLPFLLQHGFLFFLFLL